jgi:WD40 repeat protein
MKRRFGKFALLLVVPLCLFTWMRNIKSWQRQVLAGPQAQSSGATFSPDGQEIAMLSIRNYRGEIIFLDSRNMSVLETLGADEFVYSLVYSPDKSLLAGVCLDGLRVWDRHSKRLLYFKKWKYLSQIAFGQDNKLAVASTDGTLRLWDIAHDHVEYRVKISAAGIEAIDFSPDGRLLAVGTNEYSATASTYPVADKAIMEAAKAIRPQASGTGTNTIYLWDCGHKRIVGALSGHTKRVLAVDFSHERPLRLVSGATDGTIKLWDVSSRKIITSWPAVSMDVAFSRDDKTIAISTIEEQGSQVKGLLKFISVPEGKLQRVIPENALKLSFSPDGHKLITYNFKSNTVSLWRIK